MKIENGMYFVFKNMTTEHLDNLKLLCIESGIDVRYNCDYNGYPLDGILLVDNGVLKRFSDPVYTGNAKNMTDELIMSTKYHVHRDIMIALANDKNTKIEVFSNGVWNDTDYPSFLPNCKYRIKKDIKCGWWVVKTKNNNTQAMYYDGKMFSVTLDDATGLPVDDVQTIKYLGY